MCASVAEKPQAVLKAMKKTFDVCSTTERPYNSDKGASINGPKANPRTNIVRQRDTALSLSTFSSLRISGRLGAMMEDATGERNVNAETFAGKQIRVMTYQRDHTNQV